ncbi:Uncharacterised protein [Mycobacteroides abscessus subsp. abscessus]|nr:Uncharacterised protein [Mycobacteroides abscessus subsp. abscessus]
MDALGSHTIQRQVVDASRRDAADDVIHPVVGVGRDLEFLEQVGVFVVVLLCALSVLPDSPQPVLIGDQLGDPRMLGILAPADDAVHPAGESEQTAVHRGLDDSAVHSMCSKLL